MNPLLFVTGHAPAYRVGALERLHEREGLELALFGGHRRHGGPEGTGELPFPHRQVTPRELYSLAAGGGYRAVVCPTGGRAALLATWAGARRARVPLILWARCGRIRHPGARPQLLPLRRCTASADAVVTFWPHVSAYVRERGAKLLAVRASVNSSARASSAPSLPG